jgi:hypothetical protein
MNAKKNAEASCRAKRRQFFHLEAYERQCDGYMVATG